MISNSGTSTLGLYDFKRQLDAFGGVDYFRESLTGGYLPNARVMLNDGTIVQNVSGVNNTNNPNIDMTGWGRPKGVDVIKNISELSSVNAIDGMVAIVNSYSEDSGLGGGVFKYDASKTNTLDHVNIFNGWVRQVPFNYLSLHNAGAIGDGVTNDAQAFKRLENVITSNANNKTAFKWVVHFNQPKYFYLVDYQEFVVGTGFKLKHLFSIDYRDLGRENGDWKNDRYDNVEIMLKSDNAVIKLKDGYYCGTFNKHTKEIINTVSPFEPGGAQWEQYKDVYTVASAGQLLNFMHIKACFITGSLTLDGNRDSCVVGGRWGDTGWQTNSYGLVVNFCENASVSGVVAKNHCTDGLYFCGRQLADQNLLSEGYTLFVDSCVSFNNSRNSMAITGGTNVIFTNCIFDRAGLPDHPIASQPRAAVDVEAESFAIRDLTFTNCYFGDSGYASCSTYAGDISGVNFNNCKFVNQYNYALRNYSPYIKYNDCTILGGVEQSYMGDDLAARTQYINCEISDYVTANTDSSVLYVLDIYGGNIVIRNTTVNSKTVDLIYNDSNNNKTQSEFIDSTFNVGNVQSQNSWITGLLRNVVINDKRVNKSERYVIQMLNAKVNGFKIVSSTGASGIETWSNRDYSNPNVVKYSQSNPYLATTVPLFNLVGQQAIVDSLTPSLLKKVGYSDTFSLLDIQYNVGDTIFCTNPTLLIDRWICTASGIGSASVWKKVAITLQDM